MNTLVEAETLSESWGKTSFKNWLKEVFRNKFQILWLVSELISVVGESTKTARKISRIYPFQQKVFNLASLELNQLKCLQKWQNSAEFLQMDNKNAALSEERGGGRQAEFTENLSRFKAKKELSKHYPEFKSMGLGFFTMFLI